MMNAGLDNGEHFNAQQADAPDLLESLKEHGILEHITLLDGGNAADDAVRGSLERVCSTPRCSCSPVVLHPDAKVIAMYFHTRARWSIERLPQLKKKGLAFIEEEIKFLSKFM